MEPFIGEIRMFSGSFVPRGWVSCQGQLLLIAQNQALFSLLGTTYGGDGRVNFALPDFRGRVPIHVNNATGIGLGKKDGMEAITLPASLLPAHTHTLARSKVKCNIKAGNSPDPTGNFPAGNSGTDYSYIAAAGANEFLAEDAIVITGDTSVGQPINNMMPYLGITYIIAVQGIFPSRS